MKRIERRNHNKADSWWRWTRKRHTIRISAIFIRNSIIFFFLTFAVVVVDVANKDSHSKKLAKLTFSWIGHLFINTSFQVTIFFLFFALFICLHSLPLLDSYGNFFFLFVFLSHISTSFGCVSVSFSLCVCFSFVIQWILRYSMKIRAFVFHSDFPDWYLHHPDSERVLISFLIRQIDSLSHFSLLESISIIWLMNRNQCCQFAVLFGFKSFGSKLIDLLFPSAFINSTFRPDIL